jgi:RsiW-degrading membrane proteinase PrsW (M82 family)
MAKFAIVALSAVAWMTLLVRLDPHRGQKGSDRRMIILFVLGMLSVVPAIILSMAIPTADPTEGPLGRSFAVFTFVWAPIEEFSKFLVFFVLVTWMRSLREPADGIFQAAAVGLGFAIVENVIYALSSGPTGAPGSRPAASCWSYSPSPPHLSCTACRTSW